MKTKSFLLRIWRQSQGAEHKGERGRFEEITASKIPENASFLEMLDIVNERLIEEAKEPVAFESDCREGICGTCSLVINGVPQGSGGGLDGGSFRGAACQVYMRSFKEGSTITVEPYRVKAFPIIKDLIVDRRAYDRIIRAGGYISEHTGGAPDAATTLIAKKEADRAMDAAACIGCGACAAACPNGAAMLFVGAKVAHLSLLPQGAPERKARVKKMVTQMEEEGLGHCSNYYACEAVCPAGVPGSVIPFLNREYRKSLLK